MATKAERVGAAIAREDIERLSVKLAAARELEVQAKAALCGIIRRAHARGYVTEVEAARLAGVTRGTVRAWLGKGK